MRRNLPGRALGGSRTRWWRQEGKWAMLGDPVSSLPRTTDSEAHVRVRGGKGSYRLQLADYGTTSRGRLPNRSLAMREDILPIFGKRPRSVRCTISDRSSGRRRL